MSEEPPFPLEPVEPSAGSLSRSLRRERLTLINVNQSYREESAVIGFKININIYKKYHSLDREKKKIVKSIIEKIIENVADNNASFNAVINSSINNINIVISSPIQIQYIEKTGVKELKEKLQRYEKIVKCVSNVLQMYSRYCDAKCVESIKKCIDSYRRG